MLLMCGYFYTAQQYVALSRVTSLEGLAVLELDASKITNNNVVDPRAVAELERLKQLRDVNAYAMQQ